MKLWIVIVSSIGIASLAYFLFMLAAFAGSAVANNSKLSQQRLRILDLSMWGLPITCIPPVVMLWIAYLGDFGTVYYWWLLFPLPFVIGYLFFLSHIGK